MKQFLALHWPTLLGILICLIFSKATRQFVRRNLWLAIFAGGAVSLSLNHTAFDAFGPLVFVLSTCAVVALSSRIAVAITHPGTIDKDAHRERGEKHNRYERDWQEVDAHTRLIVTAVMKIGYLLAFALIAASVGK